MQHDVFRLMPYVLLSHSEFRILAVDMTYTQHAQVQFGTLTAR